MTYYSILYKYISNCGINNLLIFRFWLLLNWKREYVKTWLKTHLYQLSCFNCFTAYLFRIKINVKRIFLNVKSFEDHSILRRGTRHQQVVTIRRCVHNIILCGYRTAVRDSGRLRGTNSVIGLTNWPLSPFCAAHHVEEDKKNTYK